MPVAKIVLEEASIAIFLDDQSCLFKIPPTPKPPVFFCRDLPINKIGVCCLASERNCIAVFYFGVYPYRNFKRGLKKKISILDKAALMKVVRPPEDK